LSTTTRIAIICFILLLCLECNLVIIEDTYIVYWLLLVRWFVGSSIVAYCCLVQLCKVEILHPQLDLLVLVSFFCLLQFFKVGVLHPQLEMFFHFAGFKSCTHNSTCISIVHRCLVSFDTIVSFVFVLCCLLFAVCKYEYLSISTRMVIICFRFLLCLECNLVIIEDTYIVYWFTGCCLFVGSLVHRLLFVVVWFNFASLRSCTCNYACWCLLTGLFLVVYFCLL
jgi:hypothetical protein